ncbi:MAG: TolC family protein [Saprospiraceae bacterium]
MLQRITHYVFTVALLASFGSALAQEPWTLEKSILHARQNSLAVKQAQYNASLTELNYKQNKYNRLPSVNAGGNAGYQLGRTIDPTTNTFNNETIGSNGFSLDASVTLYNGNFINNSIKQSKIDLQAAQLDTEDAINTVSLQVANAYLNVLLSEEQLENAEKRLELSQFQLDQTDKLIRAGARPANERLDFLAQTARDEQAVIEARNLVEINYLSLKQLLQLDPMSDIRIVRPEVIVPADANPESFALNEVYTAALGTQPNIRANALRSQSAQLDESIARAGVLPSLSLFGSMNTFFSSVSLDFLNPNLDNATLVPGTPKPVRVDGVDALLTEFSFQGVTFPKKSYGDQLNENFGQTVGISLRVPIYNNHRNNIAIERARLGVLNQEVFNRQAEQTLKTNIQQAIANARAAKLSHQAAERSVEAAQAAYDNAQKRFDLGGLNSLEFTNARVLLDQAQVTLIQAKYQYLFNLKVVDFYLGRPLNLN